MSFQMRALAAAAVGAILALPQSGRAAVEIGMTVEGPRGPFATKDLLLANAMAVTAVRVDLVPSTGAALVSPRPVVVTRPVDDLSWQFLDALASNDPLRVVITVARTPAGAGFPQRRVITLTRARILSVQAALDAAPGARTGLGAEVITLTYERIDVEDDGARVYSSGA